MSSSRFDIYIKAGKDGKCIGDCPFSQRVFMYANLKIPKEQFRITTIDVTNKPEDFVKLNPEGKVPVLVDHVTNEVVVDSAAITAYIHDKFPTPDLQQNYDGPAIKASSGVFGKLATLLKNKDVEAIPRLKEELAAELRNLDKYLKCPDCKGQFLVSDRICELDCSVLPKLRHVQVAGKYYQNFEIPAECTALLKYIKEAEMSEVFKQTCPEDEDILHGWSRHNIMVVN